MPSEKAFGPLNRKFVRQNKHETLKQPNDSRFKVIERGANMLKLLIKKTPVNVSVNRRTPCRSPLIKLSDVK